MDKKKFKKFVEEVAVIKERKPVKSPTIRLDNDAYDYVRHGDEWVEVTAQENPTLGFSLVKLKDRNALCELGCGKIVTNQIVEKRLCFTPEAHWRTRCANCARYMMPDGSGLIKDSHMVAAEFIKHFKDKE